MEPDNKPIDLKDTDSDIIVKALGLAAGILAVGAAMAAAFWMTADAINAWMIAKWGI